MKKRKTSRGEEEEDRGHKKRKKSEGRTEKLDSHNINRKEKQKTDKKRLARDSRGETERGGDSGGTTADRQNMAAAADSWNVGQVMDDSGWNAAGGMGNSWYMGMDSGWSVGNGMQQPHHWNAQPPRRHAMQNRWNMVGTAGPAGWNVRGMHNGRNRNVYSWNCNSGLDHPDCDDDISSYKELGYSTHQSEWKRRGHAAASSRSDRDDGRANVRPAAIREAVQSKSSGYTATPRNRFPAPFVCWPDPQARRPASAAAAAASPGRRHAEMKKLEQEKKLKAAELAKELAETQKIAETAARLKAALSTCGPPTAANPARQQPAEVAAMPQEPSSSSSNQQGATRRSSNSQQATVGGPAAVIPPRLNCDFELTAEDLAEIGSGRIELDGATEEVGSGSETRPEGVGQRLEKLVPPPQLLHLHGENPKEKRIANTPAAPASTASTGSEGVRKIAPKKVKRSRPAAAEDQEEQEAAEESSPANQGPPSEPAEPEEVVSRFRSSLKSMSIWELRELVDAPTSQRSGRLMASLIRQHRKVLLEKINKIRFNCTQKLLVSVGQNIEEASDPFAEVCLDALPAELMQSISDIIKEEIPEIVILAERLTLPSVTAGAVVLKREVKEDPDARLAAAASRQNSPSPAAVDEQPTSIPGLPELLVRIKGELDIADPLKADPFTTADDDAIAVPDPFNADAATANHAIAFVKFSTTDAADDSIADLSNAYSSDAVADPATTSSVSQPATSKLMLRGEPLSSPPHTCHAADFPPFMIDSVRHCVEISSSPLRRMPSGAAACLRVRSDIDGAHASLSPARVTDGTASAGEIRISSSLLAARSSDQFDGTNAAVAATAQSAGTSCSPLLSRAVGGKPHLGRKGVAKTKEGVLLSRSAVARVVQNNGNTTTAAAQNAATSCPPRLSRTVVGGTKSQSGGRRGANTKQPVALPSREEEEEDEVEVLEVEEELEEELEEEVEEVEELEEMEEVEELEVDHNEGAAEASQLVKSLGLITQEETRLLRELVDFDKKIQELIERRQNSFNQLSFLHELRCQMLHLP